MKRTKKIVLAFAAALMLGAMITSTAGATEFLLAVWLDAGAALTTQKEGDAEGEFEFSSNNAGGLGIHATVLWTWISHIIFEATSDGFIFEILFLDGEAVSKTALSGKALLGTNDSNCAEPLIWATGLSWNTEDELMTQGTETFFTNLIKSPAIYIECTVLGVKVAEECKFTELATSLKNETGGVVDQEYSDAFQALAGLKLANCSIGGTESGELTGLESLLLTSGETLTTSSE